MAIATMLRYLDETTMQMVRYLTEEQRQAREDYARLILGDPYFDVTTWDEFSERSAELHNLPAEIDYFVLATRSYRKITDKKLLEFDRIRFTHPDLPVSLPDLSATSFDGELPERNIIAARIGIQWVADPELFLYHNFDCEPITGIPKFEVEIYSEEGSDLIVWELNGTTLAAIVNAAANESDKDFSLDLQISGSGFIAVDYYFEIDAERIE